MSLVIDGLTKRFGSVQALDGVTFTVLRARSSGSWAQTARARRPRCAIVLGFLHADDGHRRPGTAATRCSGRDARGATCPRSVVCISGCRSSTSSCSTRSLYGMSRREARRIALDWLARFRIADHADRKAESLSKGNQQKVQFIATVLHDPDVLFMDEPFSRPGPDQRRSPQRRIPRDARPRQDARLQYPPARSGRGAVRLRRDHRPRADRDRRADARGQTLDRPPGRPGRDSRDGGLAWLQSLPHVTVTRPGQDYTEVRVDAGTDPQAVLRAAMAQGDDVLRFEVADPSLEDVFVERVGALDVEERVLALRRFDHDRSCQHLRGRAPRVHRPGSAPGASCFGTLILVLGVIAIAFAPSSSKPSTRRASRRSLCTSRRPTSQSDPVMTVSTLSTRHPQARRRATPTPTSS